MNISRTGGRYLKLILSSRGMRAKLNAVRAAFYHTVFRLWSLPREKILKVYPKDFVFQIDLGRRELASVLEVLLENCYELDKSWAARDGDTILDVGANIGVYAVMQGKRAGARVLALEPSPTTFRRLAKNVALNDLKNVETFQCALGTKSGNAGFVDKPISLNSSLSEPNLDGQSVEVAVQTLDDFVKARSVRRVDVLKLDTEGYELQILSEGTEALKLVQRIVLETHRQADEAPIQSLLERAGFRFLRRDHDLWFFDRGKPAPVA